MQAARQAAPTALAALGWSHYDIHYSLLPCRAYYMFFSGRATTLISLGARAGIRWRQRNSLQRHAASGKKLRAGLASRVSQFLFQIVLFFSGGKVALVEVHC